VKASILHRSIPVLTSVSYLSTAVNYDCKITVASVKLCTLPFCIPILKNALD
jgi:hypothetical protein